MKILLLTAITLACTVATLATAQEPDRLIYRGKERMLFSNPLEEYYVNGRERPSFMIEPQTTSSAYWRGYIATWEIEDGKLFLTKVDSWLCNGSSVKSCKQVTLRSLFQNMVSQGRVFAGWFSGELRVPEGKELQYVHMGYGSTYERDLIFNVKAGKVSDPVIVDNTKKPIPTVLEASRQQLEILKASEARRSKTAEKPPIRGPKSSITIVPGQGVFRYGTQRTDLEAVIGDGNPASKYDEVYFVEYPAAGVQVSYENKTDTVHVIFLYDNAPRYEGFITPSVLTDKGISWKSTDDDVLNAYGKPLKDFSDVGKTWRRIEYPGIDFLFQDGRLSRIGILRPDGN